MAEDFTMTAGFADQRLQALETTITQSQQVINETNTRIDRLAEIVEQLVNVHTSTQARAEAKAADTSGQAPKERTQSARVKVASPADFSGDRQLGRAFLNNCRLYLELNASGFTGDKQRIHWALSYFKTGRAAKFADRILRAEPGKGLQLTTWKEFEKEFIQRFCETNERVHALTKLEGIAWHQRNTPVDDYIDSFEELIDLAGLETDAGLVMKFRRGLSGSIQDKIAEMQDAPGLDDLEGWKKAARRIYQNLEANRAFVSGQKISAQPTNRMGPLTRPFLIRPAQSTAAPSQSQYTRPPETQVVTPAPKIDITVPMEVDATRQRRALPLICFRCRQPGHKASECPRRFDVRALVESLVAEEKQDLLEQLLVEADLAGVGAEEGQTEDFSKESE
jgi:hypothetical protein